MNDKIDLAEKLASFEGHWQPRVVAQYNGNDIMVAKVQGEFVWHKHDETDDCFLVLAGQLTIQLRDRDVHLGRASSSWCRRGSSTGRSRRKRSTSCSSSRPARPTPATPRPRRRAE